MPLIDALPADHDPALVDLIQFFRGPLGTVPNSVLTMPRRPKIARADWRVGGRAQPCRPRLDCGQASLNNTPPAPPAGRNSEDDLGSI
jgi:hypothetical protein